MSNNELPNGWINTELSIIAEISMGQSPDSSTYNDVKKGLPFFQGKAEFSKLYPIARKWCTQPIKIAKQGDILLSIRAPVGPTNLAPEDVCIGRGLAAIRPFSEVNTGFILYHFRAIEPWMAEQGTGSTFKAVSGGFLKDISFSFPPLAEQKEIAARLDDLLAQVDTLKTRLDSISNILKRFRQSVLAAAVSGKLTEEWRCAEQFGELTKLGKIALDIRYGTSKKCNHGSGSTPVLRIPNITSGSLDLKNLKFADFELSELENLKLIEGDLLLIRSNGSVDLVGKTALVTEKDVHCLFAGYLIRIRLDQTKAFPKYIVLCLQSPVVRQVIEIQARSTSGVNNINSKEIAALELPLPPLEEQKEIVRRVEELFAFADQVEQQVKAAQQRVNHLTQAILAKAFRGELTAQWREQNPDLISGENSAAALLARIKAEKKK